MDFKAQWDVWLDFSRQLRDLPYLAPRHWDLFAPEFKPSEFKVRATGVPAHEDMNPMIIARICCWRRYLGSPCVVSTSYTPVLSGGHSTKSQHYIGRAVDTIVPGVSLFDAYLAAERFGFPGIGVYIWWKLGARTVGGLHLDERESFPARWASPAKGEYVALDARWIKKYMGQLTTLTFIYR